MPVLGWDLDPTLTDKIYYQQGEKKHKFILNEYHRLSLSPMTRVRAQVGMLYEDLAGHAAFDGILFH